MDSHILKDIDFMKSILPDTYTVEESKTKGSIHCVSETGIYKTLFLNPPIMVDDETLWVYIFKRIVENFGYRFQEIYHNVNFRHTDFTVFLKSKYKVEK